MTMPPAKTIGESRVTHFVYTMLLLEAFFGWLQTAGRRAGERRATGDLSEAKGCAGLGRIVRSQLMSPTWLCRD